MSDSTMSLYLSYIQKNPSSERSSDVSSITSSLAADLSCSPDFQANATRNGVTQGFVFTRSGENNMYNVICLPGEDLYSGDIIGAFNSKWIVMEARADATTHKTGRMHQCNKKIKFQNGTSDVIERWCYIDTSGYSSYINSDSQLQSSSEQMAIYIPYDSDTAKIFVDKRLCEHSGYDKYGNRILFPVKVTGTDYVVESYNSGDHLLVLKTERDLYSEKLDNIDLEICDYISPSQNPPTPGESGSSIVEGRNTVRLGKTSSYSAKFYTKAGLDVTASTTAVWKVLLDGVEIDGVTGKVKYSISGKTLVVSVDNDDDLIGSVVTISVVDTNELFTKSIIDVEVVGFV